MQTSFTIAYSNVTEKKHCICVTERMRSENFSQEWGLPLGSKWWNSMASELRTEGNFRHHVNEGIEVKYAQSVFWRQGEGQSFGIRLVQLLSHVWFLVTPWTAARQASLSITNSRSLPKPMSVESVMPSNRLILCHPLLLLPSIFPSIRVFSDTERACDKLKTQLRLRKSADERPKAFHSDKDIKERMFTLIFIHGCIGAQGAITQCIALLKVRILTR